MVVLAAEPVALVAAQVLAVQVAVEPVLALVVLVPAVLVLVPVEADPPQPIHPRTPPAILPT